MTNRPHTVGQGLFLSAALLLGGMASPALAQQKIESDGDKAAYGLGFAMGQSVQQQMAQFGLSAEELKTAMLGVQDSLAGAEPKTDLEAAQQLFVARQEAKIKEATAKAAAENVKALEKAAAEKGATKTATGLVFLSLKDGDGKAPGAEATVKVHYKGTLANGTEFDSSYARGEPASFPLNGVIPCFSEGIQKMKVGGKARLTCPSEIAYGERGAPPVIPPNSVLTFDIELLEIEK